MLPILAQSQRDAKWSAAPLGTSGATIGSDGCNVTCLSMALAAFGVQTTPDLVVAALAAAGGITPDGLTAWDAIPKAYAKVLNVDREYNRGFPDRLEVNYDAVPPLIERSFLCGCPVILRVDGAHTGKETHSVLAIGGDPANPMIVDPWDGWTGLFNIRYGSFKDGLYGFARLFGYAVRPEVPALWDTAFVCWQVQFLPDHANLASTVFDEIWK